MASIDTDGDIELPAPMLGPVLFVLFWVGVFGGVFVLDRLVAMI